MPPPPPSPNQCIFFASSWHRPENGHCTPKMWKKIRTSHNWNGNVQRRWCGPLPRSWVYAFCFRADDSRWCRFWFPSAYVGWREEEYGSQRSDIILRGGQSWHDTCGEREPARHAAHTDFGVNVEQSVVFAVAGHPQQVICVRKWLRLEWRPFRYSGLFWNGFVFCTPTATPACVVFLFVLKYRVSLWQVALHCCVCFYLSYAS